MKYNAYPHQLFTTQAIIDNKHYAVFQDMGLMKTASTLNAVDWLMNSDFQIDKVLVVAPLNVCRLTWPEEIAKWDNLKHLTYSLIIGSEKARRAAIRKKADIYLINCENVAWLVSHYQTTFKYDMLVIDESSKFKNSDSKRFKALKQVIPKFKRVVELTGTPVSNGMMNIWSQIYLLDRGERLYEYITRYREQWFTKNYSGFGYKIREGAEDEIKELIKDICVSMKTEDYIQLPERMDRFVTINLPTELKQKYDEFERDQIFNILLNGEEREIFALTKGVLSNKLLQFAGGAVYDEYKVAHHIHDEKLNRLEELIDEAEGKPVLVFYNYTHEKTRILKRIKEAVVFKGKKEKDLWDAKKIPVMICHPASVGHGLNLQAGGSIIIWFGVTWDLELYQQGNKRLHRKGQTEPVIIHHLIVNGTMDMDVLEALNDKENVQERFMKSVKARIDKYKKNLLN